MQTVKSWDPASLLQESPGHRFRIFFFYFLVFSLHRANGRGRFGGQTAGGHSKAFPSPKKPLFAVPALRELKSACRLSILWDAVTVPTVCFSGTFGGSPKGQQQSATQTLRVHLPGIDFRFQTRAGGFRNFLVFFRFPGLERFFSSIPGSRNHNRRSLAAPKNKGLESAENTDTERKRCGRRREIHGFTVTLCQPEECEIPTPRQIQAEIEN